MPEYVKVAGKRIERYKGWQEAREEAALAEQLGIDITDAFAGVEEGQITNVGTCPWAPGWYDFRMEPDAIRRARENPEDFVNRLFDLMKRRRVMVVSLLTWE